MESYENYKIEKIYKFLDFLLLGLFSIVSNMKFLT